MQNFAPPYYEEENRQTVEVKPKRCAKLRKWLSNHRVIELFVIAIYCVFLLTVFIILPDAWKPIFQRHVYDERYGCYIYWFPSGNVYCNSDEDLRYIIFYTLFGALFYLTFGTLFYWLIWRAYKTDKKSKRTPVIPLAPTPFVYSPPYNIPNCSVVPTPDLSWNTSQQSNGQQNQPTGWPTFCNHQKVADPEHEMTVMRSNY
ncbi:hypothetical protein Ddc_15599 [Ditylenchus destructor]|nr:hypothetical protein Ddc_15599 [Ditylenchus destructor]